MTGCVSTQVGVRRCRNKQIERHRGAATGKGAVWADEKEEPGSFRGAKGRRPQKR